MAETKFAKILKRSSKNIQADRAERVTRAAINAQASYVMKLQSNIDKIDDELDQMLDLTASGRTTVDNRLTNFDAGDFIARYNELKMKKELAAVELKVAVAVEEELFGEAEAESEE